MKSSNSIKTTDSYCTSALELLDDESASNNSISPLLELRIGDESNSGSRTQLVEKFSISSGNQIVHVMFEKIPLWLTSLSPMSFKRVCFPHVNNQNELTNGCQIRRAITKSFLSNWPLDRIKYKFDTIYSPDLILISGSHKALLLYSDHKEETPTLFTLEYHHRHLSLKPPWKSRTYLHSKAGGCIGFRIHLGYCNFNFPLSLALIDRTLGDFIDFSNHPTRRHSLSD